MPFTNNYALYEGHAEIIKQADAAADAILAEIWIFVVFKNIVSSTLVIMQ